MLYYSSFLFNTIIIHSYLKNEFYLFLLTLNLMGTSLIYHSKYDEKHYYGKHIVFVADKFLAHLTGFYIFANNLFYSSENFYNKLVYFNMLFILFMFYFVNNKKIKKLHLLIHISYIIGTHAFLMQKNI